MATFPERVAAKASTVNIVKLLLSVVAAPFYLLGLLVGVVWLVASWGVSATMLGVEDARSRRGVG